VQCVAACFSVLQCVVVCCSAMHYVFRKLQKVAGSCSLLQCVAVCCSVLHFSAVCVVRGSMLQCATVRCQFGSALWCCYVL